MKIVIETDPSKPMFFRALLALVALCQLHGWSLNHGESEFGSEIGRAGVVKPAKAKRAYRKSRGSGGIVPVGQRQEDFIRDVLDKQGAMPLLMLVTQAQRAMKKAGLKAKATSLYAQVKKLSARGQLVRTENNDVRLA